MTERRQTGKLVKGFCTGNEENKVKDYTDGDDTLRTMTTLDEPSENGLFQSMMMLNEETRVPKLRNTDK